LSGTICHLCLGPLTYLQLTAGLRAKVGFANINAKAEGIESKPAFQRRRCLVPVDNFYE
jgi:putative SOS response-associated peptidase YedK